MWPSFGAFGMLEPLFFRDVVMADIETLGWVDMVFAMGSVLYVDTEDIPTITTAEEPVSPLP